MASNATTLRPGRMAWVIHFVCPSSVQFALLLVTEVGLTAIGAPLWLHLTVFGFEHLFLMTRGHRP
jgi:hypothetical protein